MNITGIYILKEKWVGCIIQELHIPQPQLTLSAYMLISVVILSHEFIPVILDFIDLQILFKRAVL